MVFSKFLLVCFNRKRLCPKKKTSSVPLVASPYNIEGHPLTTRGGSILGHGCTPKSFG